MYLDLQQSHLLLYMSRLCLSYPQADYLPVLILNANLDKTVSTLQDTQNAGSGMRDLQGG